MADTAENREVHMPTAPIDTPAKQTLPKFKIELVKVGARVVALHREKERTGTVSYVSNFNVFVRPDNGGHAFKVNMRDVLRKAAPLGETGFRAQVTVARTTLGRKVTFTLDAQTTAPDSDEAYKRIAEGARLMFPVSNERKVFDLRHDPDVVG